MIDEQTTPAGLVLLFPGSDAAPAVRRRLGQIGMRLVEPAGIDAVVNSLETIAADLILVEPMSSERTEAIVAAISSVYQSAIRPPVMVLAGDDTSTRQVRALYELGATDVIFPPHQPELICYEAEALMHLRRQAMAALEMSVRDELTGLYNRRYFFERLEQEIARATRNDLGIGLILFDADLFKAINDTHGHPVGDEVLKGLAEVVDRNTRRGDVLARMGGDEFALLLFGNSLDGARVCAELMRTRVAEAKLPVPDDVRVTCSWGVAAYPGPNVVHPTQDLVREADLALLRAKAMGRNRVAG